MHVLTVTRPSTRALTESLRLYLSASAYRHTAQGVRCSAQCTVHTRVFGSRRTIQQQEDVPFTVCRFDRGRNLGYRITLGAQCERAAGLGANAAAKYETFAAAGLQTRHAKFQYITPSMTLSSKE